MAIPDSLHARRFYRAAVQRQDDATVLLAQTRTMGAVYLAGYAVECIFKSAILNAIPPSRHEDILNEFRGTKAHNFEWLRLRYLRAGGIALPNDIRQLLVLVSDWSTELRYMPRTLHVDEASEFLEAVADLFDWFDRRL